MPLCAAQRRGSGGGGGGLGPGCWGPAAMPAGGVALGSIGRCASRISPWPKLMSWSWIASQTCLAYDTPAVSVPATGASEVPGGRLFGLDRCGTGPGAAWVTVSGAGGGGAGGGQGQSASALGAAEIAVAASAATHPAAILATIRLSMLTLNPSCAASTPCLVLPFRR